MLNGIRIGLVMFIGFSTAVAGDLGYHARTSADSPFKAVVSEYPEWPNRTNIEFTGRATITAKYRFVYDEENGYEKNPHMYLMPNAASQDVLPHLISTEKVGPEKGKFLSEQKPVEIWVINVDEAAVALLGEELAKEVMTGKHAKVVGEAVMVIDTFTATYECDNPFFSTRVVEVKRELVTAALVPTDFIGGC